jgi:hypothetical protein
MVYPSIDNHGASIMGGRTASSSCVELLRALSRPIQKSLKSSQTTTIARLVASPSQAFVDELNRLLNESRRRKSASSMPLTNYKLIDVKFSANGLANGGDDHFMLSNDAKMVCLHPYCSGCFHTQASMLDLPLRSNRLVYWSLEVERGVTAGTSVMFGVAQTDRCAMSAQGYVQLLGMDAFSWALSASGQVWHQGTARPYCASFNDGRHVRVGCLYNGYTSEVSFYVDGVCMGVAFRNVAKSEELRPVVCSTTAKSLFRVECACESFPTLKQLCRSEIQRHATLEQQAIVDYRLPKSIFDSF